MTQLLDAASCSGASLVVEISLDIWSKLPGPIIRLARPGCDETLVASEPTDFNWSSFTPEDCPLHLLDSIHFKIHLGRLDELVATRRGIRRALEWLSRVSKTSNAPGEKLPAVFFELRAPDQIFHRDRGVHEFLEPVRRVKIDKLLRQLRAFREADLCPLNVLFSAAWDVFRICPVSIKADEQLASAVRQTRTLGGHWNWEQDAGSGRLYLDWRQLRETDRQFRLLEDVLIDFQDSYFGVRMRYMRTKRLDGPDEQESLDLINLHAFEEDKGLLVKCLKARWLHDDIERPVKHFIPDCRWVCSSPRKSFEDEGYEDLSSWFSNEQADRFVEVCGDGSMKATKEADPIYNRDIPQKEDACCVDWESDDGCSSCGHGARHHYRDDDDDDGYSSSEEGRRR